MRALLWVFLLVSISGCDGGAEPSSQVGTGESKQGSPPVAESEGLQDSYHRQVLPLLKQFCFECHSTEKQEGDVDLERMRQLEDVRSNLATWQKVSRMLAGKEMPPETSDQLSAQQFQFLAEWVRRFLDDEAIANAGDPGPVILRRLTNAELDNTVRDLTGVDLRPTRQFPADGAAGEGFKNTGDSLVMSPALLDKYMAAAREVASHAVLLPDGIRFSRSAHSRDWEQSVFRDIRSIYLRYADPEGLLSMEPYLVATLRLREQGGVQPGDVERMAEAGQLSPRYLQRLWDCLTANPESSSPGLPLPMDAIRQAWRQTTSDDSGRLLRTIKKWQHNLWSIDPLTVSWYGRWQNETPLVSTRHRLRFKTKDTRAFFLVALSTRRGDTARMFWRNPRFEAPGKKPLLLKDVLPQHKYVGDGQVDLAASVPSRLLIELPAEKIGDREFVVDAELDGTRDTDKLVHVRIEKSEAKWRDLATPRMTKVLGHPRRIDNALNGLPVVGFQKNDYLLLEDSQPLRLPSFTVTAVAEYSSDHGGPFRSIYNNYDNPINWGKGMSLQLTDQGKIYFFTTAGTQKTYGQLHSNERLQPGYHIITATYTSEHKRIYADGKLVGHGKSKGLDYGKGTRAAIGALREFKQSFEAGIAEVLVFSGVAAQRRRSTETALGRKYGITVTHDDKQDTKPDTVIKNSRPAMWYTADRFVPAKHFKPSLESRPLAPVIGLSSGRRFQELKRQETQFREVFPLGLCFNQITPLNPGQITLRIYYREDEQLCRLMLTRKEDTRLDRLWRELQFVGKGARREHESFDVFLGFTTQVSREQTLQFEELREPIRKRAEDFEKQLIASEPGHLEALLEIASRAWRRPLSVEEQAELTGLYQSTRLAGSSHDAALRLTLARVLVSAHFIYRIETPLEKTKIGKVNDWELATRLSYFLWSSMPDARLRTMAASGRLAGSISNVSNQPPDDAKCVDLVQQARRMLKDQRIRGLATEFACQWLGLDGFASDDGKNQRQYPTFTALRGDMYEEVVTFFVDMFQTDGSVLDIIDSDHTFMNAALATFYGHQGVPAQGWHRVDGMKGRQRGGVIGMAAILSKQSGATRTSPVLRGNWIVETLLGQRLPDPPLAVPELPDAINRQGLTVRELTEKHVSSPACAKCHVRIDPYGFALEAFDAIGRHREQDLVGQPVNTHARLHDGTEFEGLEGLKHHLLDKHRDTILRQFCRKLLGFSLGRTTQLSDRTLIDKMLKQLKLNDYRFSVAVVAIIRSQQFRFHRGLDAP